MAIVTITEAARLTGKSRRTIQRHLSQGVISKCDNGANAYGIDTTELLRVYGAFAVTDSDASGTCDKSHHVIPNDMAVAQGVAINTEAAIAMAELKKENDMLKLLIEEKDKRNDDLKQAILMLENKVQPVNKRGFLSWFKK